MKEYVKEIYMVIVSCRLSFTNQIINIIFEKIQKCFDVF
jgi:hypothetical protein